MIDWVFNKFFHCNTILSRVAFCCFIPIAILALIMIFIMWVFATLAINPIYWIVTGKEKDFGNFVILKG